MSDIETEDDSSNYNCVEENSDSESEIEEPHEYTKEDLDEVLYGISIVDLKEANLHHFILVTLI